MTIAKEELAPGTGGRAVIDRAFGLSPVGYLHLRQFTDSALSPDDGFASLSNAAAFSSKRASPTSLLICVITAAAC